VTLANNTNYGAGFYSFDAQIVQGSTQVDYMEDSYAYYDEEPQAELRPGEQGGDRGPGPGTQERPAERPWWRRMFGG
jgi:hypothetical protein